MTQHFFHIEGVAAALRVLSVVLGFLRWLFPGISTFQSLSKFVQDMGTNQLPHMYERLRQIDYRMGREPTQPPQSSSASNSRSLMPVRRPER